MPTPQRVIRVPDELWHAAQAKTAAEGTNVTAILIRALKRYTAKKAA